MFLKNLAPPHLNPVSTPVSCSSNQHDTVVFKMSNNLGCSSNKRRNISNGHIKIDLMNIKNSSNEHKIVKMSIK